MATPGARPVVGDFNGDGKSDIALIGPSGWGYVSMAFSAGDGTFTCTRVYSTLAGWASDSSSEALIGDFDGDGKDDIALVGPASWAWIVVAYSDNAATRGMFNIINKPIQGPYDFATWASLSNAQPLVGDFNGDGKTDVALTGHSGWDSVPVAFSNGDGSFTITNQPIQDPNGFATWATYTGARALVGDFNGDGLADIALTGPSGWGSVPVAFSHVDGSFVVTNLPILDFGGWASLGVPIVGDFNYDHKADIALMGPSTWVNIPVAFSLSPNVTP
jgi:hypothetical protein